MHAEKFFFAGTFCYVRQRPPNATTHAKQWKNDYGRLPTFPKNWKTLGMRWLKRHGVTAPLDVLYVCSISN